MEARTEQSRRSLSRVTGEGASRRDVAAARGRGTGGGEELGTGSQPSWIFATEGELVQCIYYY